MRRRYASVFIFVLFVFSASSQASQFCFSVAKTYYEQLYCEIQASNRGSNLPAFNQFQNNNSLTQALLLKPYARQLGITLTIPNKKVKSPVTSRSAQTATSENGLEHCNFNAGVITCDNKHYYFTGNQANDFLAPGALEAGNNMQLPIYTGGAISGYLVNAYEHYLHKMIDIGLAGATLSYGSFEHIYHDLRAQGVDFYDRFESMYRYLKKDKRNMAVKQRAAPADLSANACFLLSKLMVCSRGQNNFVFKP